MDGGWSLDKTGQKPEARSQDPAERRNKIKAGASVPGFLQLQVGSNKIFTTVTGGEAVGGWVKNKDFYPDSAGRGGWRGGRWRLTAGPSESVRGTPVPPTLIVIQWATFAWSCDAKPAT